MTECMLETLHNFDYQGKSTTYLVPQYIFVWMRHNPANKINRSTNR